MNAPSKNIVSGFGEADYSALLSALDQTAIVSMTDGTGTIIYVNDTFVSVSKYSRDELIGQNHRILKSGHQPQEMFIELWKTITSGHVWRGEIKNRAKDNTYYWVDTSIAPILGENGKPERYISVRFLITKKKGLEERLSEQNLSLEKTKKAMLNVLEDLQLEKEKTEQQKNILSGYLDNIPIGASLIEVPSNKVLMVNKAGVDLLGNALNPGATAFKKEIHNLTKADDSLYPIKELPVALAISTGKKSTKDDLVFKKGDGTKMSLRSTSAPIKNKKGELQYVAVIFEDITREKEIDRAKTEFVSLASHQLRTPVTATTWYAESLLGGGLGRMNPKQHEYVEKIFNSNKRLADIVEALLNVSRIEMGSFSVSPKTVNLTEIIQGELQELEQMIRQKKITVAHKFPTSPLYLAADPTLLHIIFQNLITNAVKYTPDEGKIHIEVAQQDTDILFSISDTGYGIPKAVHGKIFTKLFRADNIKDKETEGNGLGLYIVKSILDHTGGKVWFMANKDLKSGPFQRGTTFFVLFPKSGMKKKDGTKVLES